VDAARTGITITPFQHHLFTVVAPILTATPGARALFAPDGTLLTPGAGFRNPGLADALESIARHGFAAGDVGTAVVDQQRDRGHLTAADIHRYTASWRSPLVVELGADRVHLNPAPAAGGVLVAHSIHRLASGSVGDLAAALAATTTARRDADGDLATLLDQPVRGRGTTHVSIVDRNGTACSITASNGEGNGELVDGYGFMLNNMLGEDDVNPHHSAWPVDSRLSSMMCPTIVEHADGTLTALGSGGSNRIRSAISRVVAALCLDRTDLERAVEAPRLHAEYTDTGAIQLDVEPGLDDDTVDQLTTAFPHHRLWPRTDLYFGGVHAAQRTADGSMHGVGDPRRAGAAIVIEA
jgi:gamma-glutamyltranspeptidase/glutathione hydrolase